MKKVTRYTDFKSLKSSQNSVKNENSGDLDIVAEMEKFINSLEMTPSAKKDHSEKEVIHGKTVK